MTTVDKQLFFKISSGLKNLIGRDLISDKYIAIFELVKNSYDAGATKVDITFNSDNKGHEQIIISDDGCGMTYNDVVNKWLFVAYSEKNIKNRKESTYRENIKRELAGAKGVGRFSCDRLGSLVTLYTKTNTESTCNKVIVDWNQFEYDHAKEFINIPVKYESIQSLPNNKSNGTVLIINSLREDWNRDEFLRLKRSLIKLISPDTNKGELPFDIELIAPTEQPEDEKKINNPKINIDRDIVNGLIHNDILEKLNIKTVCIQVIISKDGDKIKTTLTDRGEYIFSIVERNRNYLHLHNINFNIYFLNQSAKRSFISQMGISSRFYGSVFVYKNGFRINPYGDSGQDLFGIDNRKAQGYGRFLGTRDILGRISIKGQNEEFIETTSRAHGFIENEASTEFSDFFVQKVLKVLEKYVVSLIGWGEPLKYKNNHIITANEVGNEIISQFITNINKNDVIKVDYNPEILKKKHEDENTITNTINKLENVAQQTQDKNIIELTHNIKQRTQAIVSQNVDLQQANWQKEKDLQIAKQNDESRQKQIYFLQNNTNQDVQNLINGLHVINIQSKNINSKIKKIKSNDNLSLDLCLKYINDILRENEKIYKISDMALNGGTLLDQTDINDIYEFIKQYIDSDSCNKDINFNIKQEQQQFLCYFSTYSVGIIIDNLVSNSIKAKAKNLYISFYNSNDSVIVTFADDGLGIEDGLNVDRLFEQGYSSCATKVGHGVGLYHIKKLADDMRSSVYIDQSYLKGFKINVRFRK